MVKCFQLSQLQSFFKIGAIMEVRFYQDFDQWNVFIYSTNPELRGYLSTQRNPKEPKLFKTLDAAVREARLIGFNLNALISSSQDF